MKHVLVLVFSDLKHDARVARQVTWLAKRFDVTIVSFGAADIPNVTYFPITRTRLTLLRKALLSVALLLKIHKTAYRLFHNYGYLKSALNREFDLVVANDIDTLPLAFDLRGRAEIIFDAHEYAPRHFENNKIWRLFFQPFYIALCRKYIPKVDAMLTVGEGLAREYENSFGIRPSIITNATRYHEIPPSEVKAGRIRLIHHGIANESRRLELMIELVEHLDERFTLDLILMTSDYASRRTKKYIHELKNKIAAIHRIKVLPPVQSHQVVEAINGYDIGVFLIPPINFNYANTLPNKLFDFIQARLGVAIGPTPEMAGIVSRFDNGVISENFEPAALAQKLNNLKQEDVVRFKRQSAIAARELNAEKNEVTFNSVVNNLMGG